jgi:hypothetical protein
MAGYRIDEQVLHDVATRLDRGGAAVADGTQALGAVPSAGLGTDALDAAAADLVAGWTDLLGGVGESVDQASAHVRRCLADYTDTERRITDLFRDDG